MPELPDLQVFSTNLEKELKGKTITAVNVKVAKKLNVTAGELEEKLKESKVKKVYRLGKELRIELDNKNTIGLHLMLHGALHLFDGKNEHKHTIAEFVFSDDTGLALTDWQGMAVITLNPEARTAPDALSKEVNFAFLKRALQKRSAIKNVLLDQKVIMGIGNAYADEILWEARISPFSVANKIPDASIHRLATSIHRVLTHAEQQIRKDHPDIVSGEVRDFLVIHNAKKKESPDGAHIEHKTVGSRITYYTAEQQLFD